MNEDQNRDDWQQIWNHGNHTLTGIHFFDDEYGIAVGYDTEDGLRSIVQYTEDGGRRWNFQDFDYPVRLNSLFFVDDSHGWITATYGVIFHTSNGGKNWTVQESNVTEELLSVHFINDQIGWAAGLNGTIIRTEDGGNTWIPQNSRTTQRLNDVFFINLYYGWAVGDNGTVLRTENGGQIWRQVNVPSGNNNAVTFTDQMTGYIVGDYGLLLRTTDGGNSWQQQTSEWLNDYHLLTVSFYDQTKGWIGGGMYYQNNQLMSTGVIYQTTDGGQNWENYDSDASFSMFTSFSRNISDFSFTDAENGWAAGAGSRCCNAIYNFKKDVK